MYFLSSGLIVFFSFHIYNRFRSLFGGSQPATQVVSEKLGFPLSPLPSPCLSVSLFIALSLPLSPLSTLPPCLPPCPSLPSFGPRTPSSIRPCSRPCSIRGRVVAPRGRPHLVSLCLLLARLFQVFPSSLFRFHVLLFGSCSCFLSPFLLPVRLCVLFVSLFFISVAVCLFAPLRSSFSGLAFCFILFLFFLWLSLFSHLLRCSSGLFLVRLILLFSIFVFSSSFTPLLLILPSSSILLRSFLFFSVLFLFIFYLCLFLYHVPSYVAGICVCIFSSLLAFVLIFYLFVASFIARRLFRVSFHATNSVTSKTKRKRIDLFPWSSSSRAGRCTCRIYASPEEYNFT